MSDSLLLQDNIFGQVMIDFKIMDAWTDALADIATSFRLRQLDSPVAVSIDEAYLTPDGGLTMIAQVAGEPVRMAVPQGMWNWQENVT